MVIEAVYLVLATSGAEGVNLAVLPLTVTVPATGTLPASEKLAVVSVELFIASENVADREELSATPTAPFCGEIADTVGGVVSGTAPVVKFQMYGVDKALPAKSSAAVVMVAVYCVFDARGADGIRVTVSPFMLTVPTADAPNTVANVKLPVVNVEIVIASENLADTDELAATPVAAFAGDVERTVGGVVSKAAPVVKFHV
jgi:hypothetical protein